MVPGARPDPREVPVAQVEVRRERRTAGVVTSVEELQGSPRRWWALGVLCANLVLVVASNNTLNIALPSLARDLHANESSLQWIVDAYGIVFAGLLLTSGALADRLGRRRTMQAGLVLFGTVSVAGSFATAAWQLTIVRGLLGLSAAFIMPSTLSILTDVFRGRERATAIGIWSGFAGAGGAIGLIASGIVLEHFWWGAVFLVNVPVVLLALSAGAVLLPESGGHKGTRFDLVGALLSIAGLAVLVFGIIEGPVRGWTNPLVLGAIVVGLCVLAGFVVWEHRVPEPMLDMELFRVRPFAVGTVTIVASFFALFGVAFVLTQYLQFALLYTPLAAGLALLPRTVGQMTSSPMSARTVRRFGPRAVVSFGLTCSAIALFVLSRASLTSGYLLVAVGLLLLGIGSGQTNAPSTTLIMNTVRLTKAGVGSAVNDTTRELGGALGIAVLGSVFNSVYRASSGGHVGLLALHDRAQLSHAFDVTLMVASALLLVAALGVWLLQVGTVEEAEEAVADSGVLAAPEAAGG